MNKKITIFIFVLISLMFYSKPIHGVIQKPNCVKGDDCEYGTLIVGNLTVVGSFFNVTVIDYNVTGGININGTITSSSLISCDTIDSDAAGVFSCGTDETGAGVGGTWDWANNDSIYLDNDTIIRIWNITGWDFSSADDFNWANNMSVFLDNDTIIRVGNITNWDFSSADDWNWANNMSIFLDNGTIIRIENTSWAIDTINYSRVTVNCSNMMFADGSIGSAAICDGSDDGGGGTGLGLLVNGSKYISINESSPQNLNITGVILPKYTGLSSYKLMAYFPLDDDTLDYSGKGITSIVHNISNLTFSEGRFGKAYNISTEDQQLTSANLNTTIRLSNISGTIALWIKPDVDYDAGGTEGAQYIYDASNPYTSYSLAIITFDSQYQIGIGGTIENAPLYNYSANEWWHVAVTWEAASDTVIVYANGEAIYTNTSWKGMSETPENLNFGSAFDDEHYWEGLMDEILVFNRTLNSEEVKSLYERNKEYINQDAYFLKSDSGAFFNWANNMSTFLDNGSIVRAGNITNWDRTIADDFNWANNMSTFLDNGTIIRIENTSWVIDTINYSRVTINCSNMMFADGSIGSAAICDGGDDDTANVPLASDWDWANNMSIYLDNDTILRVWNLTSFDSNVDDDWNWANNGSVWVDNGSIVRSGNITNWDRTIADDFNWANNMSVYLDNDTIIRNWNITNWDLTEADDFNWANNGSVLVDNGSIVRSHNTSWFSNINALDIQNEYWVNESGDSMTDDLEMAINKKYKWADGSYILAETGGDMIFQLGT